MDLSLAEADVGQVTSSEREIIHLSTNDDKCWLQVISPAKIWCSSYVKRNYDCFRFVSPIVVNHPHAIHLTSFVISHGSQSVPGRLTSTQSEESILW